MNVSGTLNALRVLTKPSLCIPSATVSTFDKLCIPIRRSGWPEVKAVVLDKDNCFAIQGEQNVYKPYNVSYEQFRVIVVDLSMLAVCSHMAW